MQASILASASSTVGILGWGGGLEAAGFRSRLHLRKALTFCGHGFGCAAATFNGIRDSISEGERQKLSP